MNINQYHQLKKDHFKYLWTIDPYGFVSDYEIYRIGLIRDFLADYYTTIIKDYLSAEDKLKCSLNIEKVHQAFFEFLNYLNKEKLNSNIGGFDDLKLKRKKLTNILKTLRFEAYQKWILDDEKEFEYHSAFGFNHKLKCYSRPLNFYFDKNSNISDHPMTDDELSYIMHFFNHDISKTPIISIEIALKNLLSN